MLLKALRLSEFRNYLHLNINFSRPKNIFLGDNGQGKSNLLEAIYLTSHFKSFRSHKLSQLIRYGQIQFHIQGDFFYSDLKHELSIAYSGDKKEILWDNKKLKNQREHRLKHFCIFFSNKDIELATESAQTRRQFFDSFLSLISPEYNQSLTTYLSAIKQKNRELQSGVYSGLWDKNIVEEGTKITNARINFIYRIKTRFNTIYNQLLKQNDFIGDFRYLSRKQIPIKSPISRETFYQSLKKSKQAELSSKKTVFGPHQDDVEFIANSISLREIASQGQMKLYIYALKLTIYHYWRHRMRTPPTILLDDIFADLDEKRIAYLFDSLRTCHQVFITCANLNLVKDHTQDFDIYKVSNGQVQK